MTGPVLVGVDDSASAVQAALWAADVAAARGEPLQLVHAVPEPVGVPEWLRELAAATLRAGAATSVETPVGDPADVLLTAADGAALVVVGSYGEGAKAGLLAGSTAQVLLERAHRPLAVVRGAEPGLAPRRDGPVVVGVDGSAVAACALEEAAALATALGAHVLAVHVRTDPDEGRHPRGGPARPVDAVEQALHARVDAVRARHPGAVVEVRTVTDHPLRALLVRAASARAVVVGRRTHPPTGGIRLGSTSRGLIGFAPCPVLVVPEVDGT